MIGQSVCCFSSWDSFHRTLRMRYLERELNDQLESMRQTLGCSAVSSSSPSVSCSFRFKGRGGIVMQRPEYTWTSVCIFRSATNQDSRIHPRTGLNNASGPSTTTQKNQFLDDHHHAVTYSATQIQASFPLRHSHPLAAVWATTAAHQALVLGTLAPLTDG